jgi:hypothetical protein
VPDDLYSLLQQRAEAERRSLSAEVVVLLQQAIVQPRAYNPVAYADLFQRIARERATLEATHGLLPDSVADIRADRARNE